MKQFGRQFLEKSKGRQEKYHDSLLKGRHPNSFPKKEHTELWQFKQLAEERLQLVNAGQSLKSVISHSKHVRSAPRKPKVEVTPEERVNQQVELFKYKEPIETRQSIMARKLSMFRGKPSLNMMNGGDFLQRRSMPKQFLTKSLVESNEPCEDDFSTMPDAKIFFGSMVAFESLDACHLCLKYPHGDVCAKPGKSHPSSVTQTSIYNDNEEVDEEHREQIVFTLCNITDQEHAGPLCFGDSVWLVASWGDGASWEEGGVLAAKIREAANLEGVGDVTVAPGSGSHGNALGSNQLKQMVDDAVNLKQIVEEMGIPVVIPAFCPGDKNIDLRGPVTSENQSGLYGVTDPGYDALLAARNRSAVLAGKWRIGKAREKRILDNDKMRGKPKKEHVTNLSEIYLEQDWFYLTKTRGKNEVALRQLPKSVPEHGNYGVERRGVWRIRLVQPPPSDNQGLSKFHCMERVLYRARKQLQNSTDYREGSKVVYPGEIRGGAKFCKELRNQLQDYEHQSQLKFLAMEADKDDSLQQYFQWRVQAERKKAKSRSLLHSTPLTVRDINGNKPLIPENSNNNNTPNVPGILKTRGGRATSPSPMNAGTGLNLPGSPVKEHVKETPTKVVPKSVRRPWDNFHEKPSNWKPGTLRNPLRQRLSLQKSYSSPVFDQILAQDRPLSPDQPIQKHGHSINGEPCLLCRSDECIVNLCRTHAEVAQQLEEDKIDHSQDSFDLGEISVLKQSVANASNSSSGRISNRGSTKHNGSVPPLVLQNSSNTLDSHLSRVSSSRFSVQASSANNLASSRISHHSESNQNSPVLSNRNMSLRSLMDIKLKARRLSTKYSSPIKPKLTIQPPTPSGSSQFPRNSSPLHHPPSPMSTQSVSPKSPIAESRFSRRQLEVRKTARRQMQHQKKMVDHILAHLQQEDDIMLTRINSCNELERQYELMDAIPVKTTATANRAKSSQRRALDSRAAGSTLNRSTLMSPSSFGRLGSPMSRN